MARRRLPRRNPRTGRFMRSNPRRGRSRKNPIDHDPPVHVFSSPEETVDFLKDEIGSIPTAAELRKEVKTSRTVLVGATRKQFLVWRLPDGRYAAQRHFSEPPAPSSPRSDDTDYDITQDTVMRALKRAVGNPRPSWLTEDRYEYAQELLDNSGVTPTTTRRVLWPTASGGTFEINEAVAVLYYGMKEVTLEQAEEIVREYKKEWVHAESELRRHGMIKNPCKKRTKEKRKARRKKREAAPWPSDWDIEKEEKERRAIDATDFSRWWDARAGKEGRRQDEYLTWYKDQRGKKWPKKNPRRGRAEGYRTRKQLKAVGQMHFSSADEVIEWLKDRYADLPRHFTAEHLKRDLALRFQYPRGPRHADFLEGHYLLVGSRQHGGSQFMVGLAPKRSVDQKKLIWAIQLYDPVWE